MPRSSRPHRDERDPRPGGSKPRKSHLLAVTKVAHRWHKRRFRGLILAVEFSHRSWSVSTAGIPQRRRRVNRLPLPFPFRSGVATWTALPGTCFSTKQSGCVSRAARPRISKPGRGRKQPLRSTVPPLPLRFQRIHPGQPVLLQNANLLQRNAIYAGSPTASATGIVPLR